MTDILQDIEASGFLYTDRLIHIFVGGSELHGAKVLGTDDIDIYGIYIEPPEIALGLESLPHFVWSTAGDDRRNGPNDIDVTLYSLKRWAALACKGNPTALHFLFAANLIKNEVWQQILLSKDVFLAQTCARQFIGFADDQLKRMTGQKGHGKKGQRPEIEEKLGYDVKAAMHTIRLLYECKELLAEGQITLPRPERDLLIEVRTGKHPMEKIIEMASELFAECETLSTKSPLATEVDRRRISKLVSDCYRQAWILREC